MAAARERSRLRDLGDRGEMAAARLLLASTRRLDARALSDRLGRLGAWLLPRVPPLRKRVAENLARTRPGASRAEETALCRSVGEHFARTIADYMRMEEIAGDPGRLRIEGAEHVDAALAAGRGVVLASAHFGNWESVRLAVRAATGRDCALIYRAFNNPRFDDLAGSLIAHAGGPVLHKGREGTRALLRHVARGGLALVLVDQRQTGSPILPFLGQGAETATAAAELALRFNAALIPARGRRAGDGSFEVRFEPEIPATDSETMMREVNARISAWIEADPGQWFWLHRRWKLRARGEGIRAAREH